MASQHRALMLAAWRETMAFDSRPRLARIGCSTLVLAGSIDSAVAMNHARMLHDGIPGARLVVVDGTGHALIWTTTRGTGGGLAPGRSMRFVYFSFMKMRPTACRRIAPEHGSYRPELWLHASLGGPSWTGLGMITSEGDSGAEAEPLVANDPLLRGHLL